MIASEVGYMITKKQEDKGKRFSRYELEGIIIKLLDSIDSSLLDENYQGLNWFESEKKDFAKNIPIIDALIPPNLVSTP